MFTKGLTVALALVGASVWMGSANAISISPGGSGTLPNIYAATPGPAGGAFVDDYFFDVTATSDTNTAIQVHLPAPDIGFGIVKDLTIQWFFGDGSTPYASALVLTDGAGAGGPIGLYGVFTLPPVAGLVDYVLRVTGTGVGEGRYDFTLFATPNVIPPVPVPSAVVLFASALAGLGLLSRRRRQSAQPVSMEA